MTAFTSHFSYEFRTGIRDKTLLLMNYLFPLALYFGLGFMMSELNPVFIDTVIPAMIVVAILSGTILSMPNPLVTERDAGIFRSYKINGVPAVSILTIPALTTIMHMIIVTVVITATAPLLFGALVPMSWTGFILFFVLAAFTHAGFGMLIGVISSSSRAVVLWSQLIFLPSMLIGGLMLPYQMLPEAFARVGLLLPSTHAVNIYQGFVQNQVTGFNPLWSVVILLISGIIAVLLANYLFSWDSQNRARHSHPALALLVLVPYILAVVLM
jgi:ABC-2 type transport system permease protein